VNFLALDCARNPPPHVADHSRNYTFSKIRCRARTATIIAVVSGFNHHSCGISAFLACVFAPGKGNKHHRGKRHNEYRAGSGADVMAATVVSCACVCQTSSLKACRNILPAILSRMDETLEELQPPRCVSAIAHVRSRDEFRMMARLTNALAYRIVARLLEECATGLVPA